MTGSGAVCGHHVTCICTVGALKHISAFLRAYSPPQPSHHPRRLANSSRLIRALWGGKLRGRRVGDLRFTSHRSANISHFLCVPSCFLILRTLLLDTLSVDTKVHKMWNVYFGGILACSLPLAATSGIILRNLLNIFRLFYWVAVVSDRRQVGRGATH